MSPIAELYDRWVAEEATFGLSATGVPERWWSVAVCSRAPEKAKEAFTAGIQLTESTDVEPTTPVELNGVMVRLRFKRLQPKTVQNLHDELPTDTTALVIRGDGNMADDRRGWIVAFQPDQP